MKVKGTINIGDIKLHIDVDTVDEFSQEVYVTNVNPSCLVIPKERFDLRYLGLSYPVMDELYQEGIKTLADLLEKGWEIGRVKMSNRAKAELEDAVSKFQKMALVVGEEAILEEPLQTEIGSDSIIEALKLRPETVEKLKSELQILTIADLSKHSYSDLTQIFGHNTASTISKKMRMAGYSLTPKSKKGEITETAKVQEITEHLKEEGLTPAIPTLS